MLTSDSPVTEVAKQNSRSRRRIQYSSCFPVVKKNRYGFTGSPAGFCPGLCLYVSTDEYRNTVSRSCQDTCESTGSVVLLQGKRIQHGFLYPHRYEFAFRPETFF